MLGHEYSGTVVAVGSEVRTLSAGQAVAIEIEGVGLLEHRLVAEEARQDPHITNLLPAATAVACVNGLPVTPTARVAYAGAIHTAAPCRSKSHGASPMWSG